MNIDEAIKELKNFNSETFEEHYVPFSKALQLVIEALKGLKDCREHCPLKPLPLLPGETEPPPLALNATTEAGETGG